MPEEPAMDSYLPQTDVSHVIAQLTELLTHILFTVASKTSLC